MKANGLELKILKTESNYFNISDEDSIFANALGNAWFIAYLDHRVVIGTLVDKIWNYYKQEDQDVKLPAIQKLRIFNKDAELFVWRTKLGGHKARLKTDEPGLGHKVVDASQVLFGTEVKILDSTYAKLVEDRGTEVILPLKGLGIGADEINDRKGRLCIHTRSYIGTVEATGQATYEDVRFVEFVKYRKEVI